MLIDFFSIPFMPRQLACQHCLHFEQSTIQEFPLEERPQGQCSKLRCEVEMLGGGGACVLMGVEVLTVLVEELLVLLRSRALVLGFPLDATPLSGFMIAAMLGVLGVVEVYLLDML